MQVRIKNKDWVKEALMCDDSLVEQANIEDNSILLVDTKDDYEIIIDIDNQNQTASIRDSFKKIGKKYTVKYDSNGGTGNLDEQEVRAGFSVTLKENSFTKEDYHFVGWSEQKSSGGTIYSVGSKYRPEKDVTLYAIWSKDIVTISFNANTAEGTMESLEVEKNTETKLPENTYTKEGFNFVSWNTNQDGTGTSYNNGDNITIKENTTLYAIWEENVTATVQVSNNKITEGTTIEIGATALGSSVQNVELKLGDIVIYTKNVNSKAYTETLSLDKLSNLVNLEFYNDYTLNLKVISTTNKVKQANQEGIKNYTIGTAANLKKLATIANEGNTFSGETIIQINDIDLSSVCSASIGSWQPIGIEANKFNGRFNGNSKIIKNLYINASNNYQGLFGFVQKSEILNVTVYGSVTNTQSYTGGIVGIAINNTKIENCKNYANVTEDSTSDEQPRAKIAGIVGNAEVTDIKRCINYGKITSKGGGYIGGIVSEMLGNGKVIEDCINYGEITGNEGIAIGGIAGNIGGVTIQRCSNKNTVVSESGGWQGGIVGGVWEKTNGKIINCYNKGDIKGGYGPYSGICGGTKSNIDIENCYNIGEINGIRSTIVNCRDGAVANIKNCYYLDTCGATGDGTSKTSTELMGLASTLGNEWTNDVKDASENWKYNNGYPILKWQLNSNK